MDLTTIALLLLFLCVGAAAGLTGGVVWARKRSAAAAAMTDVTNMPDIPKQWPLAARGIVTTGEAEVWQWLRATFHDHHVLVKVPVLRFTSPMQPDRQQREICLNRLSAVYTTFAVCSADGTVVGCVDVPGKRGLDQPRRELKEALLADCHIAYTVVRYGSLPRPEAMRAAFLGEDADAPETLPYRAPVPTDSSFDNEIAAFNLAKKRAAKVAAQRQINQLARERSNRRETVPGQPDVPTVGAARTNNRRAGEWENSFAEDPDTRPARLQ